MTVNHSTSVGRTVGHTLEEGAGADEGDEVGAEGEECEGPVLAEHAPHDGRAWEGGGGRGRGVGEGELMSQGGWG